MTEYRKKMIEVAMPLEAINQASGHEKKPGIGAHPRSIQQWWARRPLASCRATLFGQLVDDPSSWPERFSTVEEQDSERKRLFGILEELVLWENSNNARVLNAARKEIAQSLARTRIDSHEGTDRDDEVLVEDVTSAVIDAYLAEVAPPVHDPFAGGGSIPLEAQRLGLRAIATDLNPVAVLINKALIEIPPKFPGREPVHPNAEKRTTWSGAEGLAEDVRRYGEWIRNEAFERIGHLYPEVDLPVEHGGGKATVIAWLWARTVESPNPAFKGVHVPLVRSFMLSTKKGKRAWVAPVFSKDRKSYRFEVKTGPGTVEIEGTVNRQGGTCLASGDPMPFPYIRAEAKAGRMKARLLAVVADGNRKRIYVSATKGVQAIAESAEPTFKPTEEISHWPGRTNVVEYGMTTFGDLFTPRQLVALTTFSDLVVEARDQACADARTAGWEDDGQGLEAGGSGAAAYGDAVAVYLSCAIARLADYNCSLSSWKASGQQTMQLFRRQAIPMVWDFSESNVFGKKAITFLNGVRIVEKALLAATPSAAHVSAGTAAQADATSLKPSGAILSCDPPYYDNIGYADLSDFFHVWHRRGLRRMWPGLLSTILTPKEPELIASPYRHGGASAAETHFMEGMADFLSSAVKGFDLYRAPAAIYYAFKQAQTTSEGVASTGWSSFLQGVVDSGIQVVSTLPSRTESSIKVGIVAGKGLNMLASSVVLACRKRAADAPAITRGGFRRMLLDELPAAIHDLQKGNIAPVDMSQASIGPGIAIFSRYSTVVEADGSAMSVRTALQLINEIVGEIRTGEGTDLDPETRFAITWFETHGFATGPYGDSETIAVANNVSVAGVAQAGVIHTGANKTRLLTRPELSDDWDPISDKTLTVWECTQHLIKRLEENGEQAASELLSRMGPRAEAARNLAYRLYTHCERKGNAEEARAYNGLVVAWPELEKLASLTTSSGQPTASQAGLFEGNN